jgi:hypothetical protein
MLPEGGDCRKKGKAWRREGFEPSMGLPPNRISNWTQKRDRRDFSGVLRSDAGVSRSPEALQRICGSTQSSTHAEPLSY